MPGLELIGPIAGKALIPAPDPVTAGFESMGLFVVGDAFAIRNYSGPYPGWRWLCRAQGPILDRVRTGAFADPVYYCTTREAAQAAYVMLRQQAIALGLQPQDGRDVMPLNDPACNAERFYMHGEEVLRLFFDHMTDLQTAVRNTQAIWQFDANPSNPAAGVLASYSTQNDVLYLAIARAASGAVEHLVLVYSDQHKPEPTIREGMPRAEWITTYKQSSLAFPSGIAIVQWGRFSGADALWQESAENPAQTLHARLGQSAVIPLAAPAAVAPRLSNVPAAYAVRMEPGNYKATYYELSTPDYGGFSCCAISREGAPSFLAVVVGNAAGMVYGGLQMEQYAKLSVERDDLLMRLGGSAVSSGEMAALCQKYGQPVMTGNEVGRAARISGWEKMIQGDAAFSAQWAVQMGIARYRLQGIEPSKEQIAALAVHQNQVQAQLESHHKRHQDLNAEISQAAKALIEMARSTQAPALVAACATQAPNAKAEHVFYHALAILKDPKKYAKVERVNEVTENIARAHYATLPPADQKVEGKFEKYVKDAIAFVYEKNGLKVPGVGGFLNRFMDKL